MQAKNVSSILLAMLVSISTIGLPSMAKSKGAADSKAAATTESKSTKASDSANDKKVATEEKKTVDLTVTLVNASKSVKQGEAATVTVKTEPGATAKITVKLKSGVSSNAQLAPTKADASGNASWTWTVAKNTAPGPISYTVEVSFKRKKANLDGTMNVESAGGSAPAAKGETKATKGAKSK